MAEKVHVLVVDDEAEVRDLLQEYLSAQDYDVSTAESTQAARAALDAARDSNPVELVILDLKMLGENGLDLARELRDCDGVAVIMLTASGETIDRIVGLEVGADDYLAKPFDPRELLARIRSVLRRLKAGTQAASAVDDASGGQGTPGSRTQVRFGRCLIDLEARRLFEPDGTEIPVTAMQFSLMEVFLSNPNRVLARDRLLELAHKRGDEPFDHRIDIRVARLRRKIEKNPEKPRTIKTVHGMGYVFVLKSA
jgi:two-component system phosphate regulon response regulator OmpR